MQGIRFLAFVTLVAFLVLWPALSTMAEAIDPDRLAAAKARVEKRWADAGYNDLHTYDTESLARLSDDSQRRTIVDEIAHVLMDENPAKADAVLAYVNGTLIPFIAASKPHYVCIEMENYYNFNVSTEELATVQEVGEAWLFDLSFWLIQTEEARAAVQLALPRSYDELLGHVRPRIERSGWKSDHNKVRLDCAQASLPQSRFSREAAYV